MKFLSSDPQRLLTRHLLDHESAAGFVGVGIGKTGATLDAINQLLRSGESKGVLVMAPMRVANLTWPMEVNKWDDFKWMKVANLRHEAGKRAFLLGKAQIYVCNFEGIPNLLKLIKQRRERGAGLPYDTLVVDESTKLKNPSAKRPQAYRRDVTRKDHKRIWILTGTPAPNSLLDLFAQIRFADGGDPKRLGPSFEHFKQTYFKQSGYGGYKWAELPGSKEAIENRIADITLTLRSKDWLDIPETIVEDIEIPLGTEMAKEYRDFERQLIMEVKGTEITAANAAALVSKLLQFTSGAIYDSEKQWHRIHDLKLKALGKLVKETKGPVLVACSFRHEQQRIRAAFPQAKFFDDAKSPGAQMELLEAWNAGKVPMLVAHPKSVGHGLNLQHGGNVIVWFTLTYSREDYEQMIARLARRGQEDITYVYRLMCPDTVDYAVATVIEEKRATEDRLLTALQLLESYREKPLKLKTEEVEDWI